MRNYTGVAQVAVYLDDNLLRRLDRAARRQGTSRSRLVTKVLHEHLEDALPEAFFRTLGGWGDARPSKVIVREIRTGAKDRPRAGLE